MRKNVSLSAIVAAIMFVFTIIVTKNMFSVTTTTETEMIPSFATIEDEQLLEYQAVIKEINEEYGTCFQVGNLEMFREYEMSVKSIQQFRSDLRQDAKEFSKRYSISSYPSGTYSNHSEPYPKDAYNYETPNTTYKKKTVLYNIIPLNGLYKI